VIVFDNVGLLLPFQSHFALGKRLEIALRELDVGPIHCAHIEKLTAGSMRSRGVRLDPEALLLSVTRVNSATGERPPSLRRLYVSDVLLSGGLI
jgi:hypothetical protein